MSWISRFVNVFRDRRVQRDLDEELRFHLEARAADLVRAGASRQAADAEAARKLGAQLRWREASRDVKLLPWLDSLLRDVRFGLRMLARHTVVSSAAVLSLALALGAVTAAFALIDALMLRPLPVAAPEQLVALDWTQRDPSEPSGASKPRRSFSYPLFQRLRDAAGSDAALFATSFSIGREVSFAAAPDETVKLNTEWMTADAMRVLGLQPALGRLLTAADDEKPGQHPVATISHALWMRRFGGNPAVLGQWLTLNDLRVQVQIVGVMPAGFTGIEPGVGTDLWLPVMMAPHQQALTSEHWNWLLVLGRVTPGASADVARARLVSAFSASRHESVGRAIRPDAPAGAVDRYLSAQLHVRDAATGTSGLRETLRRPLGILAIVAALVLLIACSNVANLMLARAAAREREMALRVSLGAGRARLVQQVLIESALLAAIASLLGLLFARAAAPLIVSLLAPDDAPAYLDLRLDWRVVGFAALAGLLTTVLFGLAPAWRARRVAPHDVLKAAGTRQAPSARMFRPLIALQLAFSVIVLFLSGLFLLSFVRLANVDPGLNADNLLLFSIKTDERARAAGEANATGAGASRTSASAAAGGIRSTPPQQPKALAFATDIRRTLAEIPQVEGVSLSAWDHFIGGGWTSGVRIPGRPADRVESVHLEVSPGFIDTLQIGLVAGRDFEPRDSDPAEPATVIVNEAFARHYFPGEVPIGRRYLRMGSEAVPQEIVGVMRDAKYSDLREAPPPTVYLPLGIHGTRLGAGGALQVRTALPASAIVPLVRDALARVHPSLRVVKMTRQTTLIGNTMLRERLLALLSAFFAGVALLLAGIGLYGVLSYAVVQRTREIGIRLALGARRPGIVRTVVLDVMLVAVLGLGAGLAGGWLLSTWVASLLFDVRPSDAVSFVWPIAGLLLVALLAALPPAWRATRVDPLIALRSE